MKEMFEASVDGQAYDPDKWGQYFKPAGFGGSGQATGNAQAAPAAKPAAAPIEEDDVPFERAAATPAKAVAAEEPKAEGNGSRAADILAMIRSRNASN
jgi:hypothetical protein